MKNLINKKNMVINLVLFFICIGTILLSFSYTFSGEFVFMSGLFSDNKNIIQSSFNSSILSTIAIILCAIGLNGSGEIMQTSTNNPLASPFSLGLTSSINLVYIINKSLNYALNSYLIGLFAILIIMVINIIPIYFINKNKNAKTQNNVIFYGIAISALLTTITMIFVHMYGLSDYVYGWITNISINVTDEKLIAGSIYMIIGIIIVLFNLKNISVYSFMKNKSSTLGINNNVVSTISLIAASFLAVGSSLIYAPLMLIGLVLPYLTKKFIIKKFSLKESIIISTFLSIIVMTFSRVLMGLIKWNDFNLMLTVLLLPIWTILELWNYVSRKKSNAILSAQK